MSDTNYVQSLDSRKDLVRRYGKRLPTIHAVQKLDINDGPSEEPKALPLKWLTDKPVWVGQWPMTSEKIEALEKRRKILDTIIVDQDSSGKGKTSRRGQMTDGLFILLHPYDSSILMTATTQASMETLNNLPKSKSGCQQQKAIDYFVFQDSGGRTVDITGNTCIVKIFIHVVVIKGL
ncbi:putative HERV-K-7p22.1 provirus ancestral Pol protein [Cricetulus griseus]|uniref:Putative HERV-K-7p22.1 provirus ancestral Pol protein n=1 Tax=Cricetulus griseus TaxID=10029 RepID=A0A061HVY1_CRIGR|nr:putative HERV-K-7p22.1 provirus ancestral Pol protein [Cricetulus griseus]